MSFDNSRFTFDPFNDYSGVVMQQGRVQTDADWNEWLSELSRRIRAGALDTMGHAVYPVTTPNAFQIAADNSGGTNTVRIGLGRMYIDGILAENHGDPGAAVWDSALEEQSNTPQPQPSPAPPLGLANSIDFAAQPYAPGATVPQQDGQYLAYLDVWRRPVTYIEDSNLVDVAIGVDTTGRVQTAWQVGLVPVPSATIPGAVTTPGFANGDQVTQAGGATATVVGTVPTNGPMTVVAISGTPQPTGNWTNSGDAVFVPSGLPVSSSSTVAGTVQSGAFIPNEQVVQNNSLATANLIGPLPAAGPMMLGVVTGSTPPTSGDNWVGQQSGAIFAPSAAPALSAWSCSTPDANIPWPISTGVLTNGTVSSTPSGPCCLSTGAGYTGVENQFYRVEIHSGGSAAAAGATFKWSRENASVQTGVTAITPGTNTLGAPASVLTVQSLGRDQVLGFSAGNWIEITNQTNDDNCQPGELCKIDSVDVAGMTVTLTTLSTTFTAAALASNQYTRIARWDQSGKIYRADNTVYYDLDAQPGGPGAPLNGATGIPVPTDGTTLILENGMTVTFGLSQPGGNYLAMDYWNFSTRTADGSYDHLKQAPPRGLHHHYTKLSIVTFASTSSTTSATNCRTPWPPTSTSSSGGCGCCTYTVGDGVTSFGMYTSIQAAVQALNGGPGEVCILPGNYYENVLLQDLEGVVIHGCEWQTFVYSKALQSSSGGSSSDSAGSSIASQTQSGLAAVFTVIGCQDLEFNSFSITAADGEVGILMDRASQTSSLGQGGAYFYQSPSEDIVVKEMEIVASTLPAMVARYVEQLTVEENHFSMLDVRSIYPAVYMSGEELLFVHNQVDLTEGDRWLLQVADNKSQTQDRDLDTGNSRFRTKAAGGIQIGGPSREVYVLENSIIGGNRNGITLGNIIFLDPTGGDTYMYTGLLPMEEDPCSGGGNGGLPGGGSGGSGGSGTNPLGAGGVIRDLYIERNQVQNFGMSGIGPVGYFNLNQTAEVVSLVNVNITANTITSTLRRKVVAFGKDASAFGYGAIGLPDVKDLAIRDNTITDFGVTPGAEVCGIFVLHGESVEISRNQIRETRDLTSGGGIGVVVVRGEDTSQVDKSLKVTDKSAQTTLQPGKITGLDSPYQANPALSYETYGGMRAGIYINLVTPLTEDASGVSAFTAESNDSLAYKQRTIGNSGPSYAPGIPALRIQENQVRVALGLALSVRGRGPFAIVNNHFSSGGIASVSSRDKYAFSKPDTSLVGTDFGALTVSIMNMGVAIDRLTGGDSFAGVYGAIDKAPEQNDYESVDAAGGAVLFTNNICQLDATRSRARGAGSVIIFSLDHILFTNNHLRVDARRESMMLDAMLFGISLHATSNRFQENAGYPVLYSGMTLGLLNITSQNISSYCLRARAFTGHLVNAENLVLNSTLCRKGRREVSVQALSGEETAEQGVSADVLTQEAKGKVKGKS